MKILALSYLFPNSLNPEYGIFVYNRLKAVALHCDLRVIVPLQWFPFLSRLRRSPSSNDSGIGKIERFQYVDGIHVFYPRFFSIPLIFKWIDSFSYFISILPIISRLRTTDKFDFDIIDIHWTYPDILSGYLLSKIFRKKYIVTIRGMEALYTEKKDFRRFILNFCLKRANKIVVLSYDLKIMVEKVGVKKEKIATILNGVDLNKFTYIEKKNACNKLGFDPAKIILLSIGRLTKQKGHHQLLKVLPSLSEKYNVELHIIGGVNPEQDYSGELKGLVAHLGLNNVYFHNNVQHENLAYWYAAADLFCLATYGEGCPNVVLEALACGCPCVVSDVGAVSDLLTDGVNGFVVRMDDCNWQKYIEKALQCKWDRVHNAETMKGKSWAACAEEVLMVYKDVLESGNTR